jgi:hypothetical protein
VDKIVWRCKQATERRWLIVGIRLSRMSLAQSGTREEVCAALQRELPARAQQGEPRALIRLMR